MGAARVANRVARAGRRNPANTAATHQQYQRILASVRQRHQYGTVATRNRIAAAAARKLANPGEFAAAQRLAEEFHGRPAEADYLIEEIERYEEFGGILGFLCELRILDPDEQHETPISFMCDEERDRDNILVMGNVGASNIEFVGGDQSFDWWRVPGASRDTGKNFALVGPVSEITYFADKHHLGPPVKQQAAGMEYFHRFGEDPKGDLPWLAVDVLNQRMILIGGDYVIKPEGITG